MFEELELIDSEEGEAVNKLVIVRRKEKHLTNEAFVANSAGEDMFDKIGASDGKPKIQVAMQHVEFGYFSNSNVF